MSCIINIYWVGFRKWVLSVAFLFSMTFYFGCIRMPNPDPLSQWKEDVGFSDDVYVYPFSDEISSPDVEIVLSVPAEMVLGTGGESGSNISAAIPPLKYNKEMLFMLSQDDCVQSAFCYTLAAINGWPLPVNDDQFYNYDQQRMGDFPPYTYKLENELFSTDGTGIPVRFSFTSTISPEDVRMTQAKKANPNYVKDYGRFKMQAMLSWNDVRQMINHGVSIAFHDMLTNDPNNHDTLILHFAKAQEVSLKNLNGRGIKMLVEPNGNKNYIDAGRKYSPLKIFTSSAGAEDIIPFKVNGDISGKLVNRYIPDAELINFRQRVVSVAQTSVESRPAIGMLMHRTSNTFVSFLKWLYEQYGSGGDDSIWATSLEEYYEYSYNRCYADISMDQTLSSSIRVIKLRLKLPSAQNFYYPSVTVNIHGLTPEVANYLANNADAVIVSGPSVTGLSAAFKTLGFSYEYNRAAFLSGGNNQYVRYNSNESVLMININCRKNLLSNAEYFVNQYVNYKKSTQTDSLLVDLSYRDALYFVNQLKNSPAKNTLLKKLGK